MLGLDLNKQLCTSARTAGGVVAQSSGEISGGGLNSCMGVASRMSGPVSNGARLCSAAQSCRTWETGYAGAQYGEVKNRNAR